MLHTGLLKSTCSLKSLVKLLLHRELRKYQTSLSTQLASSYASCILKKRDNVIYRSNKSNYRPAET